MKSFSDYINSNRTSGTQNLDDTAGDILSKNKGRTTQDLMQEFLSVARGKIKSGEMNLTTLEKTFATLSPYLNEEQKSLFNSILRDLRNEN